MYPKLKILQTKISSSKRYCPFHVREIIIYEYFAAITILLINPVIFSFISAYVGFIFVINCIRRMCPLLHKCTKCVNTFLKFWLGFRLANFDDLMSERQSRIVDTCNAFDEGQASIYKDRAAKKEKVTFKGSLELVTI